MDIVTEDSCSNLFLEIWEKGRKGSTTDVVSLEQCC